MSNGKLDHDTRYIILYMHSVGVIFIGSALLAWTVHACNWVKACTHNRVDKQQIQFENSSLGNTSLFLRTNTLYYGLYRTYSYYCPCPIGSTHTHTKQWWWYHNCLRVKQLQFNNWTIVTLTNGHKCFANKWHKKSPVKWPQSDRVKLVSPLRALCISY